MFFKKTEKIDYIGILNAIGYSNESISHVNQTYYVKEGEGIAKVYFTFNGRDHIIDIEKRVPNGLETTAYSVSFNLCTRMWLGTTIEQHASKTALTKKSGYVMKEFSIDGFDYYIEFHNPYFGAASDLTFLEPLAIESNAANHSYISITELISNLQAFLGTDFSTYKKITIHCYQSNNLSRCAYHAIFKNGMIHSLNILINDTMKTIYFNGERKINDSLETELEIMILKHKRAD